MKDEAKCPYCGPDGTMYSYNGDGKVCPHCNGTAALPTQQKALTKAQLFTAIYDGFGFIDPKTCDTLTNTTWEILNNINAIPNETVKDQEIEDLKFQRDEAVRMLNEKLGQLNELHNQDLGGVGIGATRMMLEDRKRMTETINAWREALEMVKKCSLNPAHTMTKLGLEECLDACHKVACAAIDKPKGLI